MSEPESTRIESVLDRIKQAYAMLFEQSDTVAARERFLEILAELERIVARPESESERIDGLHLVADLGAELGDGARVRRAAAELVEHLVPEDAEELESLVEDLVTEWVCFDEADRLLARPDLPVDAEARAALHELVAEARATAASPPLSVEQILALRTSLLDQGVLRAEGEGFVLEHDEEAPLRRTRAWLAQAGLDPERVIEELQQQAEVSSDAEVLVGLQPAGLYDVLAHWPLERAVRQYWLIEAADELEEEEEWCAASPDGLRLAIFDEDDDVGYLYVYDRADEELVVSPLWLYNRQPAPEDEELRPGRNGGAPLMPRRFLRDPTPRPAEAEEVELLWTDDSNRVAIKVDGEFLGFIDLETGQGFAFNLKEVTDVGSPWPEGMAWEG